MKYTQTVGNNPAEVLIFVNRGKLIKLLCLAAICMGLAISGCDLGTVDASSGKNSKKENNMESIQATTLIQPKIPPIDAAVIPEIETATFAMG